MKKLILAAFMLFSGFAAFAETDAGVVDTYKFAMQAKMPYLNKGVRTYAVQTLSGKLYIEYADTEQSPSRVYAVVQNKKTKVIHHIEMTECVQNLMGKSNKAIVRSVPTIYWLGNDDDTILEDANAHERLHAVSFSGYGTLAQLKAAGCTACGVSTSACMKTRVSKGYFTGLVECLCPDDTDWDHTVEANACGAKDARSTLASVWGQWKAQYEKTGPIIDLVD